MATNRAPNQPLPAPARWGRDPRHYQIVILATLLLYGLLRLDLEIRPAQAAILLAASLAAQWFWTRALGRGPFEPRSALISGLSLCLLLRTASPVLAAAAAFVTISSKFLVRFRGKHVFNPTNFGIVVMILATGSVWVSPGQWGAGAWFGFLLACLGGVVVSRAARADVTFAFLGSYAGLLVLRALRLGDPLAIPLHQLQSGALLIFAFLMISDPKTTPDSRSGRILFAVLVALGGYLVQFGLYRPNGVLYSLAFFCCLVPVIDRLLPGRPYAWPGRRSPSAPGDRGGSHETLVPVPVAVRVSRAGAAPRFRILRLLRGAGRCAPVQ